MVVPCLVQGSANPQTPGSKNKRIKSCVRLPAAGRRTQLFILIFTEPGVCGFAKPCTDYYLGLLFCFRNTAVALAVVQPDSIRNSAFRKKRVEGV